MTLHAALRLGTALSHGDAWHCPAALRLFLLACPGSKMVVVWMDGINFGRRDGREADRAIR